jgi:hypothetical protein
MSYFDVLALLMIFAAIRWCLGSAKPRRTLRRKFFLKGASARLDVGCPFLALFTRNGVFANRETHLQTSHKSAASRSETSGSRLGTNSCATYPLNPESAMPRITPSH